MLRARLRYSITSALTSSLLVLATPAVLAEAVSSKADATALLVADLAEDENVEDVEHSEPRRGSAQARAQAETTSEQSSPQAPPVEAPEAANKPREIAPNIDLKEVAPLPEPEPEASDSGDSAVQPEPQAEIQSGTADAAGSPPKRHAPRARAGRSARSAFQ